MSKTRAQRKPTKHVNPKVPNQNHQQSQQTEKQPPWSIIRDILTCRTVQIQTQQPQNHHHRQQQQQPEGKQAKQKHKQHRKLREDEDEEEDRVPEESTKKCKKMKCSGSLCNSTKVTSRPETALCNNNNDASRRSMKASIQEPNGAVSASSSSSLSAASNNSSSSITGSFKGMPFRKLSSCYECRTVVDPAGGISREPSLRSTVISCPECGEIFLKAENLELHQAVKHAVSELGPDDTSKNIVEIIFHSSWLKKQSPVCKIDRILKVHNTQKTICRFEEYRDSIKAKATKLAKKNPRCIADGNELLRFYCTTFACSLGLNGSSSLCNSTPQHCKVCCIIKNGFDVAGDFDGGDAGRGILTTATSGKAHDKAAGISPEEDGKRRAMLVCRVIAGRVKKNAEGGNVEEYDSVGGSAGAYSNLDELYVFNPVAILPCFVVIYRGF